MPQAPWVTGDILTAARMNHDQAKTAPAIAANVLTLDLNNGANFEVSLNANINTLTISNPPSNSHFYAFSVVFTADGTARTITWPAAVKWPGGTAPTWTSTNLKKFEIIFETSDGGTTWRAFFVGDNF